MTFSCASIHPTSLTLTGFSGGTRVSGSVIGGQEKGCGTLGRFQ